MLWFCSQGNKLLLSSFSENICKTESGILIIENASCSNAICIRMFLDPWRKFTVFWTKYQQELWEPDGSKRLPGKKFISQMNRSVVSKTGILYF